MARRIRSRSDVDAVELERRRSVAAYFMRLVFDPANYTGAASAAAIRERNDRLDALDVDALRALANKHRHHHPAARHALAYLDGYQRDVVVRPTNA